MSRVAGHGLVSEGAAYGRSDGGGFYRINLWTVGGSGFALCECDAFSPYLESAAKRKRWHREHKAEVSA